MCVCFLYKKRCHNVFLSSLSFSFHILKNRKFYLTSTSENFHSSFLRAILLVFDSGFAKKNIIFTLGRHAYPIIILILCLFLQSLIHARILWTRFLLLWKKKRRFLSPLLPFPTCEYKKVKEGKKCNNMLHYFSPCPLFFSRRVSSRWKWSAWCQRITNELMQYIGSFLRLFLLLPFTRLTERRDSIVATFYNMLKLHSTLVNVLHFISLRVMYCTYLFVTHSHTFFVNISFSLQHFSLHI